MPWCAARRSTRAAAHWTGLPRCGSQLREADGDVNWNVRQRVWFELKAGNQRKAQGDEMLLSVRWSVVAPWRGERLGGVRLPITAVARPSSVAVVTGCIVALENEIERIQAVIRLGGGPIRHLTQ
jgi:hypothetical protein